MCIAFAAASSRLARIAQLGRATGKISEEHLTQGSPAMDRYFFDLYSSEGAVLDQDGQLFASRETARSEAVRILRDVAHDEMPDQDLVRLTVKVRGDKGAAVFEASLTLSSGWQS